eukprot:m.83458 g.83458  ORF g.83458 m.83458 type:complete len:144 (+) comp8690_c0_seq1:197-628(+)
MVPMIERGEFIETAEFGVNLYGTSKMAVQRVLDSNRIPILDIEMQGCESLKAMPEFSAKYVSLLPPNREALIERLHSRSTDSKEDIEIRTLTFTAALDYGSDESKFDAIIVNDNLEDAYKKFIEVLQDDINAAKVLLDQSSTE